MNPKYFGTNGIRGIFEQDLTREFLANMGSAIASFYKKGTIVLGSDIRNSSPEIKKIIVNSFLSSGLEVIDLGLVPTPLVQFAVTHMNSVGGIVITASHNPPQFNGIKVIDSDGIEISRKKQILIERTFEREDFVSSFFHKQNKIAKIDLIPDYIAKITNLVEQEEIRKKKLKVIIDPANSVGGLVTPRLLEELGVKVVTINHKLDGNFPGRGVEPKPEILTEMSQKTLEKNADFSVAHDGDADRAIFGDNKGRIYYGDKSIALIQKEILNYSNNKCFVTPISSSKIVEDIADEIGGEIVWTPVGCIYVSRKMIDIKSILGGEENGGVFYAPHQSVRDGAMAAVLVTQILARTEKTMNELINELPQYHQLKEKIKCPNQIKEKVMKEISSSIKASEIITLDGIKLIFPDGWILIRPSGTEPIFRVFVESSSKDKTVQLLSKGLKIVNRAIKKIK